MKEGAKWVVDGFSDRLVERDPKRVEKDNVLRAKWNHKLLATFDTREAAVAFMVKRAKERVIEAGKELAKERMRLKKCEAKASASHD